MKFTTQSIEDVILIEPTIHGDDRGYFVETFRQDLFEEAIGYQVNFVQDNESKSNKGVLRGLHFQKPPFTQGKLVRVMHGAVLDVAVDLRKNSPTYGQWESVELNHNNKWMYWIPPGFAHGFVTLEDNTVFFYKCTNIYNKESEDSIQWNDPDLNIDWKIDNPILSDKDKSGPLFKDFKSLF